MKSISLAVLASCFLSCSAGIAPATAPAAVGHVELVVISPPPGSMLTEQSELVADLRYSIDGYKDGVDYFIAPLFASAEKAGTTFNMLDGVADLPKITKPAGTTRLRHSVGKELRSNKLAKPLTLWFYLMERTGKGQTRVIGKTEALVFKTP